MRRLWEKCKRRKHLTNEQLYHSEFQRRLGLCSLIAIGSVLTLSTVLFVILPSVFAVSGLHSPPLASVFVSGLLIRLTASQLSLISRTIPKNGLLYNLASVLNSEALGFAVAWTQFFDGFSFSAILTQTLSDHINLLFNSNLQLQVSLKVVDLLPLRLDALALLTIWLSASLISCSLRVLVTISIIFLICCLFTSTSTTVVALLHNIVHLEVKYINFPYEFDEIFNGSCWLLILILCLELLTFVPEESEQPCKLLPLVFPVVSKSTIIFVFLATLAFFPFGLRQSYTHESLLPSAFNTISIFSARYLMTIGSICGLSAAVLVSLLYGSRLMCTLANDKLLPDCVGLTSGRTGSCRVAVVITALAVSFFSVVPKQVLCRLLPLNICLRLVCQAILVYKSCFAVEQDELNQVANYEHILVSNRSSMMYQQSELEENYSFGSGMSSSDDEEDNLILNKLWKVDGNECESSFSQTQEEEQLSRADTATSSSSKFVVQIGKDLVAVPLMVSKLDNHNCLIASCEDAVKKQKWPQFHIYESECAEPNGVVLRKRTKDCDSDTDKTHRRAMRYMVYFIFLSVLIAMSHKIIRKTTEYLPILPLITLVTSITLIFWILIAIFRTRRNADVEKGRYLPCECLLSVFVVVQFLLNFSFLNYLVELTWLLLGSVLYILVSQKQL